MLSYFFPPEIRIHKFDRKIGMPRLNVKTHGVLRFGNRFYSKKFLIDRVRYARLISTGVRSPACRLTDIKIVEIRPVTYLSLSVT